MNIGDEYQHRTFRGGPLATRRHVVAFTPGAVVLSGSLGAEWDNPSDDLHPHTFHGATWDRDLFERFWEPLA